jgi:hypothetical protein
MVVVVKFVVNLLWTPIGKIEEMQKELMKFPYLHMMILPGDCQEDFDTLVHIHF